MQIFVQLPSAGSPGGELASPSEKSGFPGEKSGSLGEKSGSPGEKSGSLGEKPGSPGERTLPEWAIVELQGDLESRSGGSLASQFIGDLHFSRSGQPALIVGHHIMWGRVADLHPPMLLFHKAGDGGVDGNNNTVVSGTCLRPGVVKVACGGETNGRDLSQPGDSDPDGSRGGPGDSSADLSPLSSEDRVGYIVRAIIRKKIMFKSRPKPIIAHVPTKL